MAPVLLLVGKFLIFRIDFLGLFCLLLLLVTFVVIVIFIVIIVLIIVVFFIVVLILEVPVRHLVRLFNPRRLTLRSTTTARVLAARAARAAAPMLRANWLRRLWGGERSGT